MKLLAIDIGSSSVKGAILTGAGTPRRVARIAFPTRYEASLAQVAATDIEKALQQLIAELGLGVRTVDVIVPATMAPSWLAMDSRGRALTPIVTHQDRRAIVEAQEIEARVGKERHLAIACNRPFPGGISSTTWRWFNKHERSLMKRADLVGHLSTWLLRQWCDSRVTDPSNAGFMGLYETATLGGWSAELIAGAGVRRALMPELRQANEIAGSITRSAATRFGLTQGTPMLAGCLDGSAAMFAAPDRVGQLLNVCGSTDVLALMVDRARPHEHLLTRPLGVGNRWLVVATLAAAGSAVDWGRRTFFREMPESQFYRALTKLAAASGQVRFHNRLAGSRTVMDAESASISGLDLGSTREQILGSLCDDLARSSAARFELLRQQCRKLHREIYVSGAEGSGLHRVIRRDWRGHGHWRFRALEHATLRGLWQLSQK